MVELQRQATIHRKGTNHMHVKLSDFDMAVKKELRRLAGVSSEFGTHRVA